MCIPAGAGLRWAGTGRRLVAVTPGTNRPGDTALGRVGGLGGCLCRRCSVSVPGERPVMASTICGAWRTLSCLSQLRCLPEIDGATVVLALGVLAALGSLTMLHYFWRGDARRWERLQPLVALVLLLSCCGSQRTPGWHVCGRLWLAPCFVVGDEHVLKGHATSAWPFLFAFKCAPNSTA